MGRGLLAIALVVAAAVADRHGGHGAAFYLLAAAIPAAAAVALSLFGELVELPGRAPGELSARLRTLSWTLVLAFLVLTVAARARAVEDVGVPAPASSALLACLLVLTVHAVAETTVAARRLRDA